MSPGLEPDDTDPLSDLEGEDSWEPPSPSLGGPGQLLVAAVLAFAVGAGLLALAAAVSWLFRLG